MKNETSIAHLRLAIIFGLICLPIVTLGQTAISCGQTITSSISEASEIDQYTYSGTAGELIRFAFYAPVDCYYGNQHTAEIYNPSGQLIATLNDCGLRSTILTIGTGTYLILVHGAHYSETGNYGLSIQSVINGGCNSTMVACGQTQIGNIS